MPKGIYQRTESHKQKLREQIIAAANGLRSSGRIGRYERTTEHRKAFADRVRKIDKTGSKNHRWKGDDVGYTGVHLWMAKIYGKPSKCDICSTEVAGVFDWANISGKYLRIRSDWKRLCRSCHMKEDGRGIAAGKILNDALHKMRSGA